MIPFDVIGIGVNAVDVLLRIPPTIPLGGKYEVDDLIIQGGGLAATATCVCSLLGWRSAYVAKIGQNTLSRIARSDYQARGILADFFIETPSSRPAFAMIQVDQHTAERTIYYNMDNYQHLQPSELPLEAIKKAKVLILDGYEPAAVEAVLELVAGTACRTVLDLENGEPEIFRRLVSLGTDVILPLETARSLTDGDTPQEVLQRLAEMTRGQLVVTNGLLGSWALTPEGIIHQKAFSVKAVDTTGCGDAFHGAYAVGILEGMNLEQRLEFSAWIAAHVASRLGGRTALPSRRQLASLDQSMLTEPMRAILTKMVSFIRN